MIEVGGVDVSSLVENNGLAVAIDEGDCFARAFDLYHVIVDQQSNKRIPVKIIGCDVNDDKGFNKYRMIREKESTNLLPNVTRKIELDMNYDENFDLIVITNREKFLGSPDVKPEYYSWSVSTIEHKGSQSEDNSRDQSEELLLLNPDIIKLRSKKCQKAVDYLESVKNGEAVDQTQLDNANESLEEAIHQLMELQPFINRLPRLLASDGDSIQIKPVKDSLPLVYKQSLGEPCNVKSGLSLSEGLADMVSLVKYVKGLHKAGVAHGDIKLSSLRKVGDEVVLRIPERFSIIGGEGASGYKNFTFYNNSYHAPECRFPSAFGSDNSENPLTKWEYTHATKEGDIWSFGVLIIGMIFRMQGGKEALKDAGVLKLPLADYMKDSGLYDSEKIEAALIGTDPDKYLLDKKSLLDLNLPAKSCWASGEADEMSKADNDKLSQLVELVKDCTNPDPEKRLNAENVHKRLVEIVEK